MKKVIVLLVLASVMLLSGCSVSPKSQMIDLEFRHRLTEDQIQSDAKKHLPPSDIKYEELLNVFSVVPGKCELSFIPINKKVYGLELKVRVRLNKTIKPGRDYVVDHKYFDSRYNSLFSFFPFNAEGKTIDDYYDEPEQPLSAFVAAAPTPGDFRETYNHERALDFYYFLTSAPGTEFDLILSCNTIGRPNELKKRIENTKGIYITYRGPANRVDIDL